MWLIAPPLFVLIGVALLCWWGASNEEMPE